MAVWRAAKKRDTSIESILYGPKMIAMVSTETGKLFTSLPPWKRAYRWLVRIKLEMDGQPVELPYKLPSAPRTSDSGPPPPLPPGKL